MNEALRGKVLDLMNRRGIGYFDYAGPDWVLTLDADLPEQEHPPIIARTAGIFLWRHPADQGLAVWPRRVRQGEIIEEGRHDDLLQRGGHYAELYNTYFRHQSLAYIEQFASERLAAQPDGRDQAGHELYREARITAT